MRIVYTSSIMALLLLPAAASVAQQQVVTPANDEEYIRTAEAGAPESITRNAAVARLDQSGTVAVLREGTNNFTCTLMPDGTNAPVCADQHGFQWLVAATSRQPKPTNTEPGIAYMARGGSHFETEDGRIVMEPSSSTKEVQEPPHWMLLWPVDSATSGIPTRPNPGGTYIMFAGTPYAHLMIYQDPARMRTP